jgi:hypothetical protein
VLTFRIKIGVSGHHREVPTRRLSVPSIWRNATWWPALQGPLAYAGTPGDSVGTAKVPKGDGTAAAAKMALCD